MNIFKLNCNNYRPNVLESWLIILAGVMVAGNILGGMVSLLMTQHFPSTENNGLASIVTYIFTFLCPWLFIWYRIYDNAKRNKPVYVVQKPNFGRLGFLGILVLIIVAMPMLGIVGEPIVSWWKMPQAMIDATKSMARCTVWAFLSVVLVAPIVEECLLRGVILKGLLHHTSPTAAIIWSAAMFAIMHGNPWQALPAFLYGCFFGWIYYRTRCLGLSIFCHTLTNGITYLLMNIYVDLNPQAGWKWMIQNVFGGENLYFLYILIALVIFVLCCFVLNKFMEKGDPYSFEVQVSKNED